MIIYLGKIFGKLFRKERIERMKKKKRWGDRKDGTRVRDIDGLHAIMTNLFPNRCEAEVYIQEQFDVTNVLKYVEEHNGEGAEFKMTPFHLFVHALGKLIYHRPLLNRFIQGRRIYDRNVITLAFVVRRKFEDKSEELLLVMPVDENQTLNDTCKKIIGDASDLRDGKPVGIDSAFDFYVKLPRFGQRLFVQAFRIMDFHGWVPESITKDDSNYATLMMSNLGSVKCDAPYHHLNNYGTTSIMVTIGEIHKAPVLNKDGESEIRDVVNFGITLDERIADGFYFARCVRLLKEYIEHPECLELPVKEDPGYDY